MTRRKTQEEFELEISSLVGDEYTFLEDYVNTHKKIKVRHNVCGYEYEIAPKRFIHEDLRCLKCTGYYRKTEKEFKQEVYSIVGDEYKVVGGYKKLTGKVRMEHELCGYVYEVRGIDFLKGYRCNLCRGKVKITGEEFNQEVKKLCKDRYRNPDEFVFIDRYAGTGVKLRVIHNIKGCGAVARVKPNNFKRGYQCQECKGVNKLSIQEERFKEKLKDYCERKFGNIGEYTLEEGFKGRAKAITFKHNAYNCGREYKVSPRRILEGAECPTCTGRVVPMQKTHKDFLEEVKDSNKRYGRGEEEYVFIEDYKGSVIKIKVEHTTCGCIYKVAPNRFLQGVGCPKCYGTPRRTNKEFTEEVKRLNKERHGVEDEYVFLEEYETRHTKIKVRHNIEGCQHEYGVRPSDFMRKGKRYTGCPSCRQSKGELRVDKELKELGVEYGIQHKLLKNPETGAWLTTDFVLYVDKKIRMVIEYDGEQHYRAYNIFGGEEGYRATKKRDRLKNKYCEENGIPILRIPYWEFNNIDNVLKDFLEELKIEVK